jgi:hypothetical protein
MFRDREQRTRILLDGLMALLVIGFIAIASGVWILGNQIRLLSKQQAEYRVTTEAAEVEFLGYARAANERWEALQNYNPKLAVPRIVPATDGARNTTPRLIVPPAPSMESLSPTPSPAPSVTPEPRAQKKIHTRTVVRYRTRPTPKPWYRMFESTR